MINDNTKFIFVSIYIYDKDILDKTPYSDTESEEESMILSPHSDVDTGMAKGPQKREHTSQRQTRKKMVNQLVNYY